MKSKPYNNKLNGRTYILNNRNGSTQFHLNYKR